MEQDSNDQKSSVVLKNPQTLLREYCFDRSSEEGELLPKYELESSSGESHCPTFNMSVTVPGLPIAYGSGKSKAKAKHDAAFNLLKVIEEKEREKLQATGESVPIQQESELCDATNISSKVKHVDENQISENTVGILQELCMSQKWSLPIYDLLSEEPNGHEKLFKMQCVINGQPYTEVGCAGNKKLAKKYAAHHMLKHFSDLLMGLGHSFGPDENTTDDNYKTPLAILQEVCTQQRFSLNFEHTSMEGESHDPVFVILVKAGKFTAEGRGSNKKKAKQASAEAVLQLMEEKGVKLKKDDEPGSPAKVEKAIKNPTEPIGLIKEICLDHEMEKPTYECVSEEGPPHARIFTIVCKVSALDLQKTGSGESKKIAKKEAALLMYKKLRKMNYLPLNDSDGARRGSNESSSADVSPTKKKTGKSTVPVFGGITEGAVGLASPDDYYNKHLNTSHDIFSDQPSNGYHDQPIDGLLNQPIDGHLQPIDGHLNQPIDGHLQPIDGHLNQPNYEYPDQNNDLYDVNNLSNYLENTNLDNGYAMGSMDGAYGGIGNGGSLQQDMYNGGYQNEVPDTVNDLALPEPTNFTFHDFSHLDLKQQIPTDYDHDFSHLDLKQQLPTDYELGSTSPKKKSKGIMGSLKKKLNKI